MSRSDEQKIAVVLSGFPRRSETFVLHEVLALEARGLLAAIFATKPGDGRRPHPDTAHLKTPVHLLEGENAAAQAENLVAHLSAHPVAAIHAYFAHLPAEVAARAARRLHIPFGFSAHARDVRKVTPAALAQRARQAACVVACNHDVAATLRRAGLAVELIPHGVDTRRFCPRPFPPSEPFRLLAVGRLVEKKGFAVLIRALAHLPVPFNLRIVGDGPEHERLSAAIRATNLHDRVALCGSRTHAELPYEYAAAHAVVVPSIIDGSGDRDGLPNVVLEAMASGRPVVASDVAAISSAVIASPTLLRLAPNQTGLLVPSGDAAALARNLAWLARRPDLWLQFGQNGRRRVEEAYELGACTERLCRHLESVYIAANTSPHGRDFAVGGQPVRPIKVL